MWVTFLGKEENLDPIAPRLDAEHVPERASSPRLRPAAPSPTGFLERQFDAAS
jgi:hypothetical protein